MPATLVVAAPPPAGHPAPTSSVLGWDLFALTSVLVLHGTALIGCRRLDQPAGDIGTMVLLIGDDDRSDRAAAMLDTWRDRRTPLRLRPTRVSGAIELYEDGRAALRAPLLLA
jgi:hypothetical protein